MCLRERAEIQEMLRAVKRAMKRITWMVVILLVGAVVICAQQRPAERAGFRPVVVAQLSDLHIGLNKEKHPDVDPEAQLKRAIEMINARGVDAIVVTGDIGDNPSGWPKAHELMKQVNAPVYWLPGNHDVHQGNPAAFRKFWGHDYFSFRIRDVEFVCINSQLLGNYDDMNAPEPQPLSSETASEAQKMLVWLEHPENAGEPAPRIRIAVQHVPIWRGGKAPDTKHYWTTHEPWRTREIDVLRKLGVHDVIAGHWHKPATVNEDGFTQHVAPAVSFAGPHIPIGFVIHTIGSDGGVQDEIVTLN